jgi:hypothetical protein
MKFGKNCWLLLASIGIGTGSAACGGTVDGAPGSEQETASVEAELIGSLREIRAQVNANPVPWTGVGDRDVTTRDGRSTNVKVQVSELRVQPGNYITAHVVYQIDESNYDYTQLRWDNYVWIPIDPTWTVNQILSTEVNGTATFWNKNWNTNPFPGNYNTNTCVESAVVKFDGSGRDDQGNANAVINLHLRLDVTEQP